MRLSLFLVGALLACAATFGGHAAAQRSKPKPKPKVMGARGTSQLPGSACKIGQAYTLGKGGESAFNVALTGIEYRVVRLPVGQYNSYPDVKKKLVVLRFTVQNPLPKKQRLSKQINWTAVSNDSENVETTDLYRDNESHDSISQVLNPGEKVKAFAYLEVTGKGEINKIIAANRASPQSLVARYMVGGIGKAIDPPYVDAADSTGATALDLIKGPMHKVLEVSGFDVAVMALEATGKAIPEYENSAPPNGKVYLLVTYLVTNKNGEGARVVSFEKGWLNSAVIDVDGGETTPSSGNFRPDGLTTFDPAPVYDQTVTFRKVYTVASGVKLDYIRLQNGPRSREIRIDLGGYVPKG